MRFFLLQYVSEILRGETMVLTYYEVLKRIDEILVAIEGEVAVDPYELIQELRNDMVA